MPTSTRETFLARYHYDPLDRQVGCAPFNLAAIQRFYCKTRLVTELQGAKQHTILQHEELLLAQQQREDGKVAATLLATDQQRSVLNALDANQLNPLAYSPYGHRPLGGGLLSLLGFNGERPDPLTGHYHLGNGYRQFNPVLMRFNSPDSWSPFGEGGVNAYAYCEGDSINRTDPDGHTFKFLKKLFGAAPKTKKTQTQVFPKTFTLHPDHKINNKVFASDNFSELGISNGTWVEGQTTIDNVKVRYRNELGEYIVAGSPKPDAPMQLTHIWPKPGISGDEAGFVRNIQKKLAATRQPLDSGQLIELHPEFLRYQEQATKQFEEQLRNAPPVRRASFNSRRQ